MKDAKQSKNDSQLSLEEEMKKAAQDPLFLADVAEVMEDFKDVDREHFGDEDDEWYIAGENK
jgi:hypothetical protein